MNSIGDTKMNKEQRGIKCLNCGDIILWSEVSDDEEDGGKDCSCFNLRVWKDPLGFCLCVVVPEKMNYNTITDGGI